MTEDEQRKAQTQPFRRLTVRFTDSLVFNYKKRTRRAKNYARRCYRHLKNFCKRLIKKAYKKPRFAIEVAALVVVIFYTIFAGIQNLLLRENVNQQVLIIRPVVFANGIVSIEFKESVPTKVRMTIRNFGKTTALKVTPVGHIEIGDPDKAAPTDSRCNPKSYAPTDTFSSALAPTDNGGLMFTDWGVPNPYTWDLTEYKKNPQKKTIYLVGCIYYESLDHRHYYSDVCAAWQPDQNLSPFSPWPPCLDADRNFVE
jgi:hypothetical protein